ARAVIKVELINVQGRVVKTLASGVYDRGYHRVKVDGTSLPQGIYFVRLNTETRDEISKFLIVK
ncbi:MAG: T9SS type A sorting domain-containing protein, partial [Candidatus Hydrothermia bacterium]